MAGSNGPFRPRRSAAAGDTGQHVHRPRKRDLPFQQPPCRGFAHADAGLRGLGGGQPVVGLAAALRREQLSCKSSVFKRTGLVGMAFSLLFNNCCIIE